MGGRQVVVLVVLIGVAGSVCGDFAFASESWRADRALGLPKRLTLEVDHRTRYEFLDGQFRIRGRRGRDAWTVFRIRLRARLALTEWIILGGELQDSRVSGATQDAFVTPGVVNPVELLQAYAELSGRAPWGGNQVEKLGRFTLDLGSTRLVARDVFANSARSFTGAQWHWNSESGAGLRVFYTLPVQRRPNNRSDLRANQIEFDDEDFRFQFGGLFARTPFLGALRIGWNSISSVCTMTGFWNATSRRKASASSARR